MEISLKKREDGANNRRETEAGDKREAEYTSDRREVRANDRRETEAGDKKEAEYTVDRKEAEYTIDKREVGANNKRETEVGDRKEPSREAGTCSKEIGTAARDSRGVEYTASKEADLIDMWEEIETENNR